MRRVRVPLTLSFVGCPLTFFIMLYLPLAYPTMTSLWQPVLWALCLLACIACLGAGLGGVIEGTRVSVPLPMPDRQSGLLKRQRRVEETRYELKRAVDNLPAGDVHHTHLSSRIKELEAAEQSLRVELVHERLGKLDRRAVRLVRKEFKKK